MHVRVQVEVESEEAEEEGKASELYRLASMESVEADMTD